MSTRTELRAGLVGFVVLHGVQLNVKGELEEKGKGVGELHDGRSAEDGGHGLNLRNGGGDQIG